jgi:hypothetical protein
MDIQSGADLQHAHTNEDNKMMKFMRSLTLTVPAVVVFASPVFAQTKPSIPTFSLTLSAPKVEVTAGSKVFITVMQTNLSQQTIDCSAHAANGVDYSVQFDVRDQHGMEAAKVALKHPELLPFSFQHCTLAPGESKTRGTLISGVYQLSEPGEYKIQVSRLDEGDPARAFVKSNTITITVLPTEEQPPAKK